MVRGQPHKNHVTEVHFLGYILSTSQLDHKHYRVSLSSNLRPSLLRVIHKLQLWINHTKLFPSKSIFSATHCKYHNWLIIITRYLYPRIFIHHDYGSSRNLWLWVNHIKHGLCNVTDQGMQSISLGHYVACFMKSA